MNNFGGLDAESSIVCFNRLLSCCGVVVSVTVSQRNFAFRLVLSLLFSFAILLDEWSTQQKREKNQVYLVLYPSSKRQRGLYGAKCKYHTLGP